MFVVGWEVEREHETELVKEVTYGALMMKFLSPPSVPVHVPLLYKVKGRYFNNVISCTDGSEKWMQARQL